MNNQQIKSAAAAAIANNNGAEKLYKSFSRSEKLWLIEFFGGCKMTVAADAWNKFSCIFTPSIALEIRDLAVMENWDEYSLDQFFESIDAAKKTSNVEEKPVAADHIDVVDMIKSAVSSIPLKDGGLDIAKLQNGVMPQVEQFFAKFFNGAEKMDAIKGQATAIISEVLSNAVAEILAKTASSKVEPVKVEEPVVETVSTEKVKSVVAVEKPAAEPVKVEKPIVETVSTETEKAESTAVVETPTNSEADAVEPKPVEEPKKEEVPPKMEVLDGEPVGRRKGHARKTPRGRKAVVTDLDEIKRLLEAEGSAIIADNK